jgi:regulator of replication initiation timing
MDWLEEKLINFEYNIKELHRQVRYITDKSLTDIERLNIQNKDLRRKIKSVNDRLTSLCEDKI